jgi:hypothetical protein
VRDLRRTVRLPCSSLENTGAGLTICGSYVPALSRGTSISTCPADGSLLLRRLLLFF